MMSEVHRVTFMLFLVAACTAEADEVRRSAPPIPQAALLGDDVAWLSYALSVNLTKEQSDCIIDNKVLFEGDKLCYPLFSQGPCKEDQWLVLDMKTPTNKQLQAKCQHQPSNFVENCGPEKSPAPSAFGELGCACKFGLVAGPSGSCHQPFSREPCGNGAVLAPVFSLQRLRTARCLPDPCSGNFPEAFAAVIQVDKDGVTECHRVSSQGPCPEGSQSVVWKKTGVLFDMGVMRLACDYLPMYLPSPNTKDAQSSSNDENENQKTVMLPKRNRAEDLS